MSITGTEQPTKVGVPIADLLAGMNGAFGVLAALHERARTGRGRVVRTSLLAGMVGVHAFQGTRWTVAGEVPGLRRRPPPVDRAVRHVRDRDGARADRLRLGGAVARLCARRWGSDAAEPSGSRPTRERVAHRDELIEVIEAALRRPRPPSTGSSCSPRPACPRARCASIDDVYALGADPARRGCCVEVDHPTLGPVEAARLAAPLRRQRVLRRPLRRTSRPRPWASTTSRSGSGWSPEPSTRPGGGPRRSDGLLDRALDLRRATVWRFSTKGRPRLPRRVSDSYSVR